MERSAVVRRPVTSRRVAMKWSCLRRHGIGLERQKQGRRYGVVPAGPPAAKGGTSVIPVFFSVATFHRNCLQIIMLRSNIA